MDWKQKKEGNIELINHSKNSVIQIIAHYDYSEIDLCLDYEEFENLKKAILKISDEQ